MKCELRQLDHSYICSPNNGYITAYIFKTATTCTCLVYNLISHGKMFLSFSDNKNEIALFFFFKENGVIWNSRFWESLQDIDMQYESTKPLWFL